MHFEIQLTHFPNLWLLTPWSFRLKFSGDFGNFGDFGECILSLTERKHGVKWLKAERQTMSDGKTQHTDISAPNMGQPKDRADKPRGHKASRIIKRVVIIAVAFIFLLYTVGGGAFSWMIYNQSFARDDLDRDSIFMPNLRYSEISQTKYPRSEFRFQSGDNQLTGYDYGKSGSRGLVILSSGVGGDGDDYMNFATRFVDDGYRVMTYDMTGVAKSAGDGQRGTYQGALDVDALLSYVESQAQYDALPIYLVGHSWGGYGVCAALAGQHRVKAVVSISGYNDGGEIFALMGEQSAGAGFYLLYPHLWTIQRLTFGSAMDVTAIDGLNAANVPALIIQGKDDQMVATDGISIYAHRNEITADIVEYLLTDGDHEWPYSSAAAKEYRLQMQAGWKAFSERPGVKAELESGEVPRVQAMKFKWADEVDFNKALYNEIDESIIEKIEFLFDRAA